MGGYEFFYQGWKNNNPTRENCRFGASREDLFLADRDATLDGTFLKKLGLTKQRMVECDALFFYQLLLPIVDPSMSGIKEDTRMGYDKEVARNTNMYTLDPRTGEEHVVMFFVQPPLRRYLSGMALCAVT